MEVIRFGKYKLGKVYAKGEKEWQFEEITDDMIEVKVGPYWVKKWREDEDGNS